MTRHLIGLVCVLALGAVGCGDEMVEVCFLEAYYWNKDNPPPLTWSVSPNDLLDTYTLVGFTIAMRTGAGVSGTVGEADFETWSGRLEINETTISSSVTIEEETETLGGPYTPLVETDKQGIFVIATESYDFRYSLLGLEGEGPDGDYVALVTSPVPPICEMTAM